MANYTAHCRSNYFSVKDRQAFNAWAAGLTLEVWDGADDRVAISPDPYDDCGMWPNQRFDYHDDDCVCEDIDFIDELRQHLTPDSVCVLQEIGYEKRRYLIGKAHAFKAEGEIVTVTIDSIYDLATKTFGAEPSRAEY